MSVAELLRTTSSLQRALTRAESIYEERFAPLFTPFQFIQPNEVRLSQILAWLLSPYGSHGQGAKFLISMLERVDASWSRRACENARVKTEHVFDKGRVDIFVTSGERVLVLENKPWAGDQPLQLERYFAYLEATRGRKIPSDTPGISQSPDWSILYVSGSAEAPSELSLSADEKGRRVAAKQLHLWTYEDHLLQWLRECRSICGAERVRVFIDEFISFIVSEFKGDINMTERNLLVAEVLKSPDNVSAALQICYSLQDIRRALLEKLNNDLLESLSTTRWSLDWNLSGNRYGGIKIDFAPAAKSVFCIAPDEPNFRDFAYGVLWKDKHIKDALTRGVLESGLGFSEQSEHWPWYKSLSPDDSVLPFDRDWLLKQGPWVAIADGRLAKSIVAAARRVFTIFEKNGLLGELASADGG